MARRIPCAFSCNREFLEAVDARAKSLHMKRSEYIVHVLRQEIMGNQSTLNIAAESRAEYPDRDT